MATNLDLAKIAYRAYGDTTGGLNFRGEPMPTWDDLGERIQQAWISAAGAVAFEQSPEGQLARFPKEPTVQKPSLGRIVLVPALGIANNGAEQAPAVITRVWSQTADGAWTVNLRVLADSAEVPQWRTSVLLYDTQELADAASSTFVAWWPPRVS